MSDDRRPDRLFHAPVFGKAGRNVRWKCEPQQSSKHVGFNSIEVCSEAPGTKPAFCPFPDYRSEVRSRSRWHSDCWIERLLSKCNQYQSVLAEPARREGLHRGEIGRASCRERV